VTRAAVLAVIALTAAGAGCGKKGPPLPPLRPIPAAVADFSAERDGERVTLRFAVPKANADGTTPVAIDRVEIYAVTLTDAAKPPAAHQAAVAANLLATIAVQPAPADTPAPKTAPKLPAPGEVVQHVDAVKLLPDAASTVARAYVAVPAVGRRRAGMSPVLVVPLAGASAAAPDPIRITYTEDLVTLTWDAGTAGTRFIVERPAAAGSAPLRLTPRPTEQTTMSLPMELGREVCVTLRAVTATGAVALVSEPSRATCETPTDTFPPEAPSGLVGTAAAGAIDLVWRPSINKDVAGYVVLRAEGAGGTLQRLTPVPLTATTYRDTAVRPGVTYEYVVIAVDTAKPGNESAPSNRESVTAR